MKKSPFVVETVLFDLLKTALWKKTLEIDYSELSKENWEEVYQLAGKQGVRSLISDALLYLDSAEQPYEELLMTWGVHVALTKERGNKILKTLKRLYDIFHSEGLEIMLLKGWDLAHCYPHPELREFGDLDIYLFGEKNHGDALLKKHGYPTKEKNKHSSFILDNVLVENHQTLIDLITGPHIFNRKRKRIFILIERKLCEILEKGSTKQLDEVPVRIPSATFNFLFLIMHTGNHLGNELVVRHLCDWACFLSTNKGKYNEKDVLPILELLNLKKLCLVMTDVAILQIGMPREFAPHFYAEEHREHIDKVFVERLFRYFPSSTEVKGNTLWWKWKRFYDKQWQYDLFYQEYLPERLVRMLWIYYNKKKNV